MPAYDAADVALGIVLPLVGVLAALAFSVWLCVYLEGEAVSNWYVGVAEVRRGVGPRAATRRGVTVVCIHGLYSGGRRWATTLDYLAERGWSSVALNYPSESMLVTEAADRLRPLVRGRCVVFIGHSLGGLVVRHLAPSFPGCHVILVNTPNRGLKRVGVLPDAVLRYTTGNNVTLLEPAHFGERHHPQPPPGRTAILYSSMPCTPGCCCCCMRDDCCVPVSGQRMDGVPATNSGWVFHNFNSRTAASMDAIEKQIAAWCDAPSPEAQSSRPVVVVQQSMPQS